MSTIIAGYSLQLVPINTLERHFHPVGAIFPARSLSPKKSHLLVLAPGGSIQGLALALT